MCCVFFSFQCRNEALVLIANRDEFLSRPTAPLAWWKDRPNVLAGKDLEQGGTWLGMNRSGKIAFLTNYRDPSRDKVKASSRGKIVLDFLDGPETAAKFLPRLISEASNYNDFNLVCGTSTELYYFSSVTLAAQPLSPGLYGLSNDQLDTPWPKVVRGKTAMAAILNTGEKIEASLFEVMRDNLPADDSELPDTGVGLKWERALSAIFIESPTYGTRSTSLVRISGKGQVCISERTYQTRAQWETKQCSFELG